MSYSTCRCGGPDSNCVNCAPGNSLSKRLLPALFVAYDASLDAARREGFNRTDKPHLVLHCHNIWDGTYRWSIECTNRTSRIPGHGQYRYRSSASALLRAAQLWFRRSWEMKGLHEF